MKPSMPFRWHCGCVLVNPVLSTCIYNPAVASYLCILLFKIFIAVAVDADQLTSRAMLNKGLTAEIVQKYVN